VQMGQRLGPAVGPLIGGVLAPLVGIRRSFLVTALFYLVALLTIVIFYKDPHAGRVRPASRSLRSVFVELVRAPGFLMLFVVIFAFQTVDRSFGPILPLYVSQLGVPDAGVATVAGILFSISAIFAALGHRIAHALMVRFDARVLVMACALSGAVAIAAAVIVPTVVSMAVALAVAGTGIGVGMTAAYTAAGRLLPVDAQVTGFGLLTTASLMGLALSPVLAGLIGASGLRIVYVFDVVLLLALAAGVAARMRRIKISPQEPVVSDASAS
jgi:MFS family permease